MRMKNLFKGLVFLLLRERLEESRKRLIFNQCYSISLTADATGCLFNDISICLWETQYRLFLF